MRRSPKRRPPPLLGRVSRLAQNAAARTEQLGTVAVAVEVMTIGAAVAVVDATLLELR